MYGPASATPFRVGNDAVDSGDPGPPIPHLDGNYEPDQNVIRLDLTEGGPSPAIY